MFRLREAMWLFVGRQERRLWVGCLFLGCSMIYATRTVMPLCVVAVSQELQWDKTQSVSTCTCQLHSYSHTTPYLWSTAYHYKTIWNYNHHSKTTCDIFVWNCIPTLNFWLSRAPISNDVSGFNGFLCCTSELEFLRIIINHTCSPCLKLLEW